MTASRPGHHVPPDFPGPVRALAAVSRALAVIEGAGIALCLLSLMGLAVFQFIVRNLRLHGQLWVPPPPEWLDGMIRHVVFVLGFLGGAYATFTGRHIRIDAITRLLRPRPRMVVRALMALVAVVACGLVGRAGLEFLQICRQEASEAGNQGQIFTSVGGAAVIVGGVALVGFHFLVQALIDLVYVFSHRPVPPSWIAEAGHGAADSQTSEAP